MLEPVLPYIPHLQSKSIRLPSQVLKKYIFSSLRKFVVVLLFPSAGLHSRRTEKAGFADRPSLCLDADTSSRKAQQNKSLVLLHTSSNTSATTRRVQPKMAGGKRRLLNETDQKGPPDVNQVQSSV